MRFLTPIVLVLLSLTSPRCVSALQVDPSTPPPPPPAESSSTPTTPPSAPIDPSTPPLPPAETSPTPTAPVFDPLHAERSLDVGTFYMKKGNYDAAIDRFQEAARYQPKLAKPWILLGETYEKKHDNSHALESYKRYLEVFPGAPDAAKVQKRIATLEGKTGQQDSKTAPN